jgi:hypothetical protein
MKTIRLLFRKQIPCGHGTRERWEEVDPILVDLYDPAYEGAFRQMVLDQVRFSGVLGWYLVVVHEPEHGKPMMAYEYKARQAQIPPPIEVEHA